MDEVLAELARFRRSTVLWVCSYITISLQLGMKGALKTPMPMREW